jgi:hypothetical protein
MNSNTTNLTRRSLNAGLLVAGAAIGDHLEGAADAHFFWYDRIRRLGQLNINEKDAETLDVDHWVRYWSSLKADGLVVSCAGIIAFYPTDVPYHHKARFLGNRDVYGDFSKATRAAKMRVIARLDPTYAFPELFEAHPDWITRNQAGEPVRHAEAKELYSTCMFGHYYDRQMTAIIKELNERYNPDGYYTNGWPGTGLGDVCYCEHCQTLYREKFHAKLPKTANRQDANYRQWTDWRLSRVLEVWNLWQAIAAESRADRIYVGNLGGSIRAEVNVKKIAESANG